MNAGDVLVVLDRTNTGAERERTAGELQALGDALMERAMLAKLESNPPQSPLSGGGWFARRGQLLP